MSGAKQYGHAFCPSFHAARRSSEMARAMAWTRGGLKVAACEMGVGNTVDVNCVCGPCRHSEL